LRKGGTMTNSEVGAMDYMAKRGAQGDRHGLSEDTQ